MICLFGSIKSNTLVSSLLILNLCVDLLNKIFKIIPLTIEVFQIAEKVTYFLVVEFQVANTDAICKVVFFLKHLVKQVLNG